jgi:hypothetical protein
MIATKTFLDLDFTSGTFRCGRVQPLFVELFFLISRHELTDVGSSKSELHHISFSGTFRQSQIFKHQFLRSGDGTPIDWAMPMR